MREGIKWHNKRADARETTARAKVRLKCRSSDRSFLRVCYAMVGVAALILAVMALPRLGREAKPVADGDKAKAVPTASAGSAGVAEKELPAEDSVSSGKDGPDALPAASADTWVSPVKSDFFEEFRLERERARSRETEALEKVANDSTTDPEVRRRAQEALLDAARKERLEFEAENLIRAKGYADAVVVISDGGASVVVNSGKLDQAGAQRIGDAVVRACGIDLRRITIVEREG